MERILRLMRPSKDEENLIKESGMHAVEKSLL